jgi:hypothetical protein
MKINQEFDELLRNPKVKFTIILGSGIHKKALYNKDSVLSSWELLLHLLDPNIKLTGQYHLDFEKIIQLKKITCEDSHKTEERLIASVQKLISDEQKRVLNDYSKCYPMSIFNPDKVSDVISLNFDEVPELLLEQQEGVKIGKHINDSSFSKSKNSEKSVSKNTYNYLATRHREVKFKGRESIRFWHPHGSIENNSKGEKIVLGLHRYSHMLETGISIRNHHMQHKRLNKEDNTWYYRLIQNPIIILGAGMSPTEWDMWFALTSRERANEKTKPIFQMRECECKRDHCHEWFQPLFTGMDFKEQWEELERLFKNIK